MDPSPRSSGLRRRPYLATLATGVAGATSGCLRRVRSITGWRSANQVQLDIKTLPADADPYALRIARQVAAWYREAGIDATITPMADEELFRQVLMRNEFDLFVARVPDRFRTPDALYSLLHSQFANAPGWQNPFGYANLDVDDRLETQRRSSGAERRDVVAQLLRTVARTQPFTVLGFPDDIHAARSDRYVDWRSADIRSPVGYFDLDRADDGDNAGTPESAATLRVVLTDRRPTENLNPLSAEYRRDGLLTGLLYDSLGYRSGDDTVEPWLADSWWFEETQDAPRATVELRSDCVWHDGEPLTADDVAFTYAFLADTSMGTSAEDRGNGAIPAPRFQGRIGLVDGVRVVDAETVSFEFVDCDPAVAARAFDVPVLPRHVWSERTGTASVGGIQVGPVTNALVTNNIPPVGSGPLAFVGNTPRESLVLERFDDHFLATSAPDALPGGFTGPPAFDRLRVQVVGADETAVELVASGEADVTGTPVGAATVPRIGRADEVDLLVGRSNSPFLVGYNTRRPPLTNPRFRHTLARLIDQAAVADDVFRGYVDPAVTLLDGTDWHPDDLRWDDGNPVVPFLGTDGELDAGRVREAFRTAGYNYEGDRLVERN